MFYLTFPASTPIFMNEKKRPFLAKKKNNLILEILIIAFSCSIYTSR